MGFFDRLKSGLSRSREAINEIFYMGGEVDEDFWEDLEDTLVMGDMGGELAMRVADDLREQAARENLTRADQLRDALAKRLAQEFRTADRDPFEDVPSCVLFVGINGAGKTTTVGKLAGRARDEGKSCLIGGADTFRAAAIEQLEVWARRAGVEMVTRERGADPASVCYDTLERAEATGAELVLIDTAGRLHTSADLMRELEKVVNVVRKRSKLPVYTVLVIDATTGQNGLQQAREFNRALDLDALIVTKLDGTAKGGIALAVSHELGLPIVKIGVGEGIDDLRDFDAREFASALVGTFDERFDADEDGLRGENAKEAAVTAGERRRDVLEGAPTCAAEAEEAVEGSAEETVEDATVEALAEVEDGEAPVVDAQGDAEEAFADAAEEAAAEPDNADLLEAALGRRTHDTLVLETEEDTSAGLEAAELTELDRNAEAVAEAAEEGVFDDAPFTDDELAELAMAAADENAEGEPEPEPEPEPAPEPEKKSFWKRLFE